jgi:hypothetical protein
MHYYYERQEDNNKIGQEIRQVSITLNLIRLSFIVIHDYSIFNRHGMMMIH